MAIRRARFVPSRTMPVPASVPAAGGVWAMAEFSGRVGGHRGCVARCRRVAAEAEGSEAGGGDAEQHAAAVIEVAPDRVERRVGFGVAVGHRLADQATGEQGGHDLPGLAAAPSHTTP